MNDHKFYQYIKKGPHWTFYLAFKQGLPIKLAATSRSAAGKLIELIPVITSAKNGGNGVTRWHHTR